MENVVSAVSIAVIIGAPIMKSLGMSFSFVGNIVVRFLLIAALVFAIRSGPLPGLHAFLAVFSILLERNHEFLSNAPGISGQFKAKLPDQKPIWPVIEYANPLQPPPLTPDVEVVHYDNHVTHDVPKTEVEIQGESTSVSDFENTGDIRDSNPRLEQGPGANGAMQFYASKNLL
jgi:hypothetical protein